MPGMLTATAGPMAPVFTTLANAKLELPSIIDSSQDAYLDLLIGRATAAIVRACKNRVFGLGTYSEVFDPQHFRSDNPQERLTNLMLSRYPVTELASITDTLGNVLSPAWYFCNQAAGIIRQVDQPATATPPIPHWQLGRWRFPVTVVYSAGWDFSDGPVSDLADIEGVALQLVANAFFARGRDPSIQLDTAQNIGETRYFDRTNVPLSAMYLSPAQLTTLQPYIALRT